LLDPQGRTVFQREIPATQSVVLEETIDEPRLWWPNGQGAQDLYQSRVELIDADGATVDAATSKIGLRRVRLVHHPSQWDEVPNALWPKGPISVPVTLEVNNRRIFVKGSNWVSPEIFPGELDDTNLKKQVRLAAEANLNFLRCWGGAPVMPESFFDAADEMGILIWQEFPLSCNRYEGSEDYLSVLDAESRSIITRLRSRTCLALWSGGNELFNKWSGMSPHDAAIRLLGRNTYDLDPDRPFLMTAPLWGMAHGPYRFCDPAGRESFSLFQQCKHTAYTEFGVFAAPSATSLGKWQDPSLLQLPGREGQESDKAGIARRHWEPARYFKTETLEDFASAAAFLQEQGYKHLFEEIRRQKPRASMALNWCFNEPTPRVVNGSVIGWPCQVKGGYEGIRDACRPVLASARVPRFVWQGGEIFEAEIWLLSDQPEPIEVESVRALLRCDGREVPLATWQPGRIEANTNLQGPTVRCRLPHAQPGLFQLILRSETRRLDSSYPLILGPLPVEASGLYPA
jgi:beta-mannosidase